VFAMPSESSMWNELRPLLAGLDPVRVENLLTSGTPDVNYTGGWIELKYAKRWPVRGGPLRVPHFTPEQRAWLLQRRKAGGRAYLLLKVGVEGMLFDGVRAAQFLGTSDKATLASFCLHYWACRPDREDFQKWI
jgi:hypothetical protein